MKASERRPNIVFVVLDTHRLDRLGCYGYQRDTSPNLDGFARQATLFENAIAPAQWTIPSHASMFSGEPPTTHMTVQSGDVLGSQFKTLAEHLRDRGYRTVGFCNNPLVGVIKNGLKRGFAKFYNYGGAIRSRPSKPSRRLGPLSGVWERYTQILRKISYPIQNAFANSFELFQAALNPFWVPLWTRFAHFKGDTVGSIRDATQYVRQAGETDGERPFFLFLNLMETHLPFSPPERFVDAFVPYLRENHAARDFLRDFNTHAVHWLAPVDASFDGIEAQTLSDMYDAEVAYQDHLLGELLGTLDRPEHRDNTAVVFVADHGEMLGEHQFMGHAFGVYQELIHVPLLIGLPAQREARRVAAPVSTSRLFHTLLDVVGVERYETPYSAAVDIRSQSLVREPAAADRSRRAVFCEAYAPQFALTAVAAHGDALLEALHCRATRWAVYEGCRKLIRVENVVDRLFSLDSDPLEMHDLVPGGERDEAQGLAARLGAFLEKAKTRRPEGCERAQADLDNELVRRRLRELGYIE